MFINGCFTVEGNTVKSREELIDLPTVLLQLPFFAATKYKKSNFKDVFSKLKARMRVVVVESFENLSRSDSCNMFFHLV